jgi:hypothetical protein
LYLILWYFKRQTNFTDSMLKLTRIFKEMAFERIHLLDILGIKKKYTGYYSSPQLSFSFL